MTTPAVTPTPDEITTHVAALRRVPGVTDTHSLAAIAQLASPRMLMAAELRAWLDSSPQTPDLFQLAGQLEAVAARHGLRITTDPGEPIGYAVTENGNSELARHRIYRSDELAAARALADRQSGIVVALLPEGGKA